MNWETIMCLGDSITIGSRSMLAYPEYCGEQLSVKTKKYWNVVNHATAGFKTVDLYRSITQNFSNMKQFSPEIITLMIGTNDLKSGTNDLDFKIAFQQILIKCKLINKSAKVLVLEIPMLIEGVMLPYSLGMNNSVQGYNEIIHSLAREMGICVASMDSDPADFYDGVHLNDQGSKKWGYQLAESILKDRFL